MLLDYLPWSGFTSPHAKKVTVLSREFSFSPYEVSAVYTNQADIQASISLINKNAIVELHTTTGIFGANVFDGYVLTVRKN